MKRFRAFSAMAVLSLLAAAGVSADEILFGLRPVPPYVMQDPATKKLSGLEYEIIRAALAVKGHMMKVELFPLARVVESVKNRKTQAGAPLLPSHDVGATLSDSYIAYNNVALALKARNFKLGAISDLKGLSVSAFQRAKTVLGPGFAAATGAEGGAKYKEEANQAVQIKLLFAGRVDVVIGESRIFRYYINDPATGVDARVPTEEFRIFPATEYRVAFVNPKHAADFNEGLAAIRKNGTYDAIMAKYGK